MSVTNILTLKTQIQQKKIPNYLIFIGDEWKVQQVYVDQIVEVLQAQKRYIDSVADIYNKLRNNSFIKKRIVYVVRDDKDLIQNEKLQQQIKNGLLGDNVLIHLVTNIDKRTKFYHAFRASIINFERLSDTMLQKYVKREITLSQRNIERLIDICEGDYGRILLEIDKIKNYVDGCVNNYGKSCYVDLDEVFDNLIKNGTIYNPPYDAIFDFVNAVLDRNVRLSFELLDQCYGIGKATLVVLTVLYNNIKAMVQVQSYEGSNIQQATGLTVVQIKNIKSHFGKYSIIELLDALKLLQKVEAGIKQGTIEEAIAIEYVLVKLL